MRWFKRETPARLEVKTADNFISLDAASNEFEYSSSVKAALAWLSKNIGEPFLIAETLNENTWVDIQLPVQLKVNTAYSLKDKIAATGQDIVLRGNSLWLKLRNNSNQLVGFQYIPWSQVQVNFNESNTSIDYYLINNIKYLPREVIHFKNGVDPSNHLLGLDIWSALKIHNDADNFYCLYISSLVKSPSPKQIFNLKDKDQYEDITKEELQRLQTRIEIGSQVNRAGNTIITTAPLEAIPNGFKPNEMVIKELADFTETRICALLGIPSQVLGLNSGANPTYSNFKEAQKIATVNFLIPLWELISQTISQQCQEMWPSESRLRFKYEDIAAMNEEEKLDTDRVTKLYQLGIIDRYTALNELGFPVNDNDKNVFFNNSESITSERL